MKREREKSVMCLSCGREGRFPFPSGAPSDQALAPTIVHTLEHLWEIAISSRWAGLFLRPKLQSLSQTDPASSFIRARLARRKMSVLCHQQRPQKMFLFPSAHTGSRDASCCTSKERTLPTPSSDTQQHKLLVSLETRERSPSAASQLGRVSPFISAATESCLLCHKTLCFISV